MRGARALAGLALGLLAAACDGSRGFENRPLEAGPDGRPAFARNHGLARYVDDVAAGRLTHVGAGSDLVIFVALSGGGKRSAAFGHGALRGLDAIPLHRPDGQPRTLLDAVDYLSGVSGGSFPAAHYALHRRRSFETFGPEFLEVDLNSHIWGAHLLPWNWVWVVNPRAGTNDHMAAVYDRLMFRGATFEDVARQGQPILSINATDIANGVPFPFLGVNFGLLCSDLNSYPIARAVAASNGFPGLFSPITLRSHAERCGPHRPALSLPDRFADNEDARAREAALAHLHARYADPARTRFVHLMDGGIADNLALRGVLNFFLELQADEALFRRFALRNRRILVLSVDGEAEAPRDLSLRERAGGLFDVLSAASGTQIDALNFETLALTRDQVQRLAARARELRCAAAARVDGAPCGDVEGHLVHLSLADIADPALRARLAAIPTGLTLRPEDSAALVELGEALTRDNPVLRRLAAEARFPPRDQPARLEGARPGRRPAMDAARRTE